MGFGYGFGGFAQGLTSGIKTGQGIMAYQDRRDRLERLDKERADDRAYRRGFDTRSLETQQTNRAVDVAYRSEQADRTEQYRQDTLTSSENAAAIAADHWEKTFEAQSELRKMQMSGQKTLNSLNTLKLQFEQETLPSRKSALQNKIKTNELAYKSANLKFEQQQDKVTASRLEVMSSFLADPKKLSGTNNADMSQMLAGLNAAYSDVINTNSKSGERKLITGGQLIEGNFHPEITVFDESGKRLRSAPWGEGRLPEDQQSIGIALPELKRRIDIKRALLGGPRGETDWVKSKTRNADDQEVTVNVGWVNGKPVWRQDSDGNVTPYKAAAEKPTKEELLDAGEKKVGRAVASNLPQAAIDHLKANDTEKNREYFKQQFGKLPDGMKSLVRPSAPAGGFMSSMKANSPKKDKDKESYDASVSAYKAELARLKASSHYRKSAPHPKLHRLEGEMKKAKGKLDKKIVPVRRGIGGFASTRNEAR